MVIDHPCPPCPSPKGDFVQRRSHIYGTGDHPRSSLLGGHSVDIRKQELPLLCKRPRFTNIQTNKIMVNIKAPKINSTWIEKKDAPQF